MTITAYNFSFYDYNMPSQQHQEQHQMDVELNDEWPTADSNTSAYDVEAISENKFNPQCRTTQALEHTTKYAQKGAVQHIEVKQQLKPKLSATPKRWSCELREKVLAQAKRSSGSDEDNNETSNKTEFKQLKTTEHQLKPKLNATPKRWSCELREKVLAQAKRKTSFSEDVPNISVAPASFHNSLNELMQKSADVAPNAATNVMTETCGTSSQEIVQKLPITVQAKISFFNKLAPTFEPKTYVNNRFLALLKNTNEVAAATVTTKAASVPASNTIKTTKTSTSRWSANLEDLVNPFLDHAQHKCSTNSTSSTCTPSFSTLFTSTPLDSKSASKQEEMSKNPAYSLWREPRQVGRSGSNSSTGNSNALQRKNSQIHRRPSSEKLRGTTSRPNSGAGSSGTKIQMHALMEDLSLVMPVRLRIAEYERKISMQS